MLKYIIGSQAEQFNFFGSKERKISIEGEEIKEKKRGRIVESLKADFLKSKGHGLGAGWVEEGNSYGPDL